MRTRDTTSALRPRFAGKSSGCGAFGVDHTREAPSDRYLGRSDTRPPVPDPLIWARSLGLQIEFLFGAWCAFLLFWLVIWILVAVWVYRDAESRHANGALWAIIVILLGLIGLII